MRLFIAFNFDDEIKDKIYDVSLKLKDFYKGNYTKKENLHLTLVFLGEIKDDKIGDIKDVLNMINLKPFNLTLNDISKFNGKGRGDTVFIDIEQNDSIKILNSFLSYELKERGFIIEDREFKPHLTLIREAIELKNQNKLPFNNNDFNAFYDRIDLMVNKISLMQSERINADLKYKEIYKKDLI